jgi:DNA-binding transcriptional MerR regulator
MYSSHNICEFFNISRETVRTWSDEFGAWLSATAKPEKGRQRQFTDSDLRVFALVSDMKKQGLLYADIKAALGAGQRGEIPDTVYAVVPGERNRLAELQTRIDDLQTALSTALEDRQRMAGQIELLTRQLEAAQDENRRLNREIGRLEQRIDDD